MLQDGSLEVARLGVDIEMRRKGVATQLVKKLEKVIMVNPPYRITQRKEPFIEEFILVFLTIKNTIFGCIIASNMQSTEASQM